ncbi:MAG: helix-turn-helix domain-containing protein [Syntrophobacter sp.]
MLGIKEKTLANWRTQGRGPQFYKFGKVIRYALDDLQKWIQIHRVRTADSV